MVLGPADPIIHVTEMWFPYGGFPIRHDTKETNWQSAIGLATTRLDGFAAWETGEQAGELLTQTIRCNGDRLFVNADATKGSLRVEVWDERGEPIPGFEADSCDPVSADTLSDDNSGWIRWKNKPDLRELKGKTIQLRFLLRNARLYSIRISDEKTMKLPVPRATNR
jgi:hypothetical protein